MKAFSPIAVEVTRGGMTESRHAVHCAVFDAEGREVERFGDIEAAVYPRSAIKPMQALPLIETGAAEACGASGAEIALACASHNGEPRHTEAAAAWLARLGLDEGALECGVHPPMGAGAAAALLRTGRTPGPLHNNCSGKHTGFLAVAGHLGEDVRGYINPDHPAQRRVRAAIEALCGVDLHDAPEGVDGCGIPVIGLPLGAFAAGLARMAAPGALAPVRAEAARRIVSAMAAAPEMVGGDGRFDTEVTAAGAHAFICKTGAEGVHAAILPGRGLGVAVKAEDGAKRAAETAMAALLLRHADVEDGGEAHKVLTARAETVIHNVAGLAVGVIRAAL